MNFELNLSWGWGVESGERMEWEGEGGRFAIIVSLQTIIYLRYVSHGIDSSTGASERRRRFICQNNCMLQKLYIYIYIYVLLYNKKQYSFYLLVQDNQIYQFMTVYFQCWKSADPKHSHMCISRRIGTPCIFAMFGSRVPPYGDAIAISSQSSACCTGMKSSWRHSRIAAKPWWRPWDQEFHRMGTQLQSLHKVRPASHDGVHALPY